MKINKRNNALFTLFVNVTVWIGIIVWLYIELSPSLPRFFSRGYTEDVYKSLEHAYNTSQYRIKERPGIIPDETVFSYAAGAYVHGIDPIMINSEHAPLGKYFLALSIILFKNDALPILICGLVSLIGLWQLSKKVIGRSLWAFIPVLLLSFDTLYVDQFRTVPLLDLMQLPFIIYSLYVFIIERENGKRVYWKTGILLGVVAAMKHPAMGALLYVSFICSFFGSKPWIKDAISLSLYATLGGIVYIGTYIRTFMSGYSVADFIGFQKWIILYQKSKFLYPFSVWKLIFVNQWQTWWGDFSLLKAVDWNILWPLGTGATFIYGLVGMALRVKISLPEKILFSWIFVYGVFLSTGVVSSRFLLPFLPFTYVLAVHMVMRYIQKSRALKRVFLAVITGIFFGILAISTPRIVYASYVLPYPSYMPGNKLYKLSYLTDRLKYYWYWGTIGQFRYHLKLSDKYLVEAKTLMEYGQYLLGVAAMERSDKEFSQLLNFLYSAKRYNIDVSQMRNTLIEASEKHEKVIDSMKIVAPSTYVWTPEKEAQTQLELETLFINSLQLRQETASGAANI